MNPLSSHDGTIVSPSSKNVEVLNPMILHGVDESSWKSLSGVRVNFGILQLVPNVKEFQSLLQCVKLWAKKRTIYGNLFGYFGGVHLAILAALICIRNPEATLSSLVVDFFSTFASWPWPMPVALPDGTMPFFRDSDVARSLMQIQLPCSPHEYCASNISKSTFYRINLELVRGRSLTKNLLRRDFDWNALFEPFLHHNKYSWFVKVWLSASNEDDLGDWVGWVKSRFPSLILKLELGYSGKSPNVVYYWGLHAHYDDSDITQVEDFRTSLRSGYEGPLGQVELSIVPSSQFATATVNCINVVPKERKACWRIPEYSLRQVPVYSQHLPSYLVGYEAK